MYFQLYREKTQTIAAREGRAEEYKEIAASLPRSILQFWEDFRCVSFSLGPTVSEMHSYGNQEAQFFQNISDKCTLISQAESSWVIFWKAKYQIILSWFRTGKLPT